MPQRQTQLLYEGASYSPLRSQTFLLVTDALSKHTREVIISGDMRGNEKLPDLSNSPSSFVLGYYS